MSNLLASLTGWSLVSTTFDGERWTLNCYGAYAEQPNGTMEYGGAETPGDTLSASVSYTVTPPLAEDLWLLVRTVEGFVFAHKIWSADGSMPVSGAFPLFVDMSAFAWATVAVSTSPTMFVAPNSYDQVAVLTLVPDIPPPPPPPPDHHVLVRYSKDGGRNWSNWKKRSLGAIGEYQQRVRFTRLGQGYRFVFQIQISSPVKRDLLGASLRIEPRG